MKLDSSRIREAKQHLLLGLVTVGLKVVRSGGSVAHALSWDLCISMEISGLGDIR